MLSKLPQQLLSYFNANTTTRLHRWLPYLMAVGAGLLFSLALAPYGYWELGILSIATLYFFSLKLQSKRQAFFLGWSYGIGLWFAGAFWLYTSIHQYGNTPAPLATLLILLLAMLMGLFNAFQIQLFYLFKQKIVGFTGNIFGFASLWIFFDWLKSWVLTGFPWLFAGYALTDTMLAHYGAIGGIYLVTAILVSGSAALVQLTDVLLKTLIDLKTPTTARFTRKRSTRILLPSKILLPTSFIGLSAILAWPISQHLWTHPVQGPALTTSLIQGNIPQNLKWLLLYRQKTLDIYQHLSTTEWGRDLVVWPEASIPMLQTDALDFINTIKKTATQAKSSWVTGIPWEEFNEPADVSGYHPFYNAIIATGYDASGIYKKQRLVPVGEYTPLRGMINWMLPELAKNGHDFSAGASHQLPLKVRQYHLGAAICYEVAYPQITRKNAHNTDFMITISNDAWFDGSNGPAQHLQMVQMRAIETGRWFIRATNTGITAFIDHKGQIQHQAPSQKQGVLRGELPPYQGDTPYMRWGEWPTFVLWAALTAAYQWAYRAREKRRSLFSR